MYSYNFENLIISLAAINFLLPSITLYRLTMPNFGAHMPLEVIYRILHTVIVDGTYFGVRVYLWRFFGRESSIFIIKNMYSLFHMIQGLYSDYNQLNTYWKKRRTESSLKSNRAATTELFNGDVPNIVSKMNMNGKNVNGKDVEIISLEDIHSKRKLVKTKNGVS